MVFKNKEEQDKIVESYTPTLDGHIYSKLSFRYMNPVAGKNGYKYVSLKVGKSTYKNFLVHRLIAWAHVPNPRDLNEVNHKDCNKSNNHHENLEWVTRQENMKHAHDNGLTDVKTAQEASRKIKKIQIPIIKKAYKLGLTLTEIGDLVGVSYQTVGNLIKGKSYNKTAL